MIALLLVSHWDPLARSAREFVTELAGPEVVVGAVGGGPSFGVHLRAIEDEIRTLSSRGATAILAIADLGSSVILLEEAATRSTVPLEVVDAPFLEGAVASAMVLATGGSILDARAAAEAAYDLRKR